MIQIIKGRVKGDWPLITRSPDKAERFKKDERQAIYEREQERERLDRKRERKVVVRG